MALSPGVIRGKKSKRPNSWRQENKKAASKLRRRQFKTDGENAPRRSQWGYA